MKNLESALYLGVGLALKGKEIILENAKKFAETNAMSEEEGKKFVDEVISSAEETKADFMAKIEAGIEKKINELGLVKKEEVEKLQARIAELEEQLKKAEK